MRFMQFHSRPIFTIKGMGVGLLSRDTYQYLVPYQLLGDGTNPMY